MLELPDSLEFLRVRIEKTIKPTNNMKFISGKTKPWESKLGGCPYLKDIADYPMDNYGDPMMFLAQINFAEMPALKDFPDKGLLQFYIVNNDCYGYDEPCKLIYIESFEEDENGLITENPYLSDMEENLPFDAECRILFESDSMPLTTEVSGFEEILEQAGEENENALYDVLYGSGSRIGGYPCFVQAAVPAYESGEKEILLLQLDTDDNAGLMFGDCGNCQFFISSEDLRNKNFSDVVYDWACC